MKLELYSVYIEEIMDRIMSYLNGIGVDFAILNGYKVISNIIRFSNNNLDVIRTHDKSFIGIDIGFKKRRLYTDIHVMEFEKAKEAIDNVLRVVDYIPPSSLYPYIPTEKINYSIIPNIFSEDDEVNQAIDIVKGLIKYSKKYKLESVSGAIKINRVKHMVYTTFGGEGEYKKSNVNINVRLFKKKYISSVFNREAVSLDNIDIDEGFIEAYNLIRRVSRVSKIDIGDYRIVLAPPVMANLLYYLVNGLSAYNIYIQRSPFVGKLGDKVLGENVNIYDNPLEPNNPGAAPFDVEGIPTHNLALVERGVIKTFLHNLSTANMFGVRSTGHAGRIVPRPHSITLAPESVTSLDNLFIDVKDGIYVTNVWYTRFNNYLTGDFSTIQRDVALLIRNGELGDAVYGCRISDNIVRMFNNIIGFAGEPRWVRWWDTPIVSQALFTAIDGVNISTGY